MYEGRTAQGRVTHTISRGRLVWADGVLRCKPGTGRYVPMAPFAPTLFDGLSERDAAMAFARHRVARAGDPMRSGSHDEL